MAPCVYSTQSTSFLDKSLRAPHVKLYVQWIDVKLIRVMLQYSILKGCTQLVLSRVVFRDTGPLSNLVPSKYTESQLRNSRQNARSFQANCPISAPNLGSSRSPTPPLSLSPVRTHNYSASSSASWPPARSVFSSLQLLRA